MKNWFLLIEFNASARVTKTMFLDHDKKELVFVSGSLILFLLSLLRCEISLITISARVGRMYSFAWKSVFGQARILTCPRVQQHACPSIVFGRFCSSVFPSVSVTSLRTYTTHCEHSVLVCACVPSFFQEGETGTEEGPGPPAHHGPSTCYSATRPTRAKWKLEPNKQMEQSIHKWNMFPVTIHRTLGPRQHQLQHQTPLLDQWYQQASSGNPSSPTSQRTGDNINFLFLVF